MVEVYDDANRGTTRFKSARFNLKTGQVEDMRGATGQFAGRTPPPTPLARPAYHPGMTIDHVAITANNIAEGVSYYTARFGAEVLYQDATWAFLKFGNTKLALVTPSQHPPHVAVSVSLEQLQKAAAEAGKKIDSHRDGTQGIYVTDPSGNAVELIHYPQGGTVYAARANPAAK